jgi:hypothetical protein
MNQDIEDTAYILGPIASVVLLVVALIVVFKHPCSEQTCVTRHDPGTSAYVGVGLDAKGHAHPEFHPAVPPHDYQDCTCVAFGQSRWEQWRAR